MDKQTKKELIDIVKKNYKQIAGHYSETRKKILWPKLKKLIDLIPDNSNILDVGCGSGKILSEFNNKKIKYLGIDSSVEMLEQAKKQYPNQNFTQGNILNLGKISGLNYDYIFCIAVIHHLPGFDLRVQALRQLKNKIKPNGKIIISVWNLWSQKKYKKLIYKFFLLKLIKKNKLDFGDILFDWKNSKREIVSKRYYHAFTKRELKKISKKAGFKNIKIHKDNFNYYLILF